MEDKITITCLILGIIVLGLIVYVVYARKRIKQSKEEIESFLGSLSRSFHDAKWTQTVLHAKDDRTNKEIAHLINEKIKRDLEYELKKLFPKLYVFPPRCFKFFTGDPTTNDFSAKIFPMIRALYQHYTCNKASLEELGTEFFTKTEEIVLLELEKEAENTKE